jgi:hypothetical protein
MSAYLSSRNIALVVGGTASVVLIGAAMFYMSREEPSEAKCFKDLANKGQDGQCLVPLVKVADMEVIEFEFFKKLINKIYTLYRQQMYQNNLEYY